MLEGCACTEKPGWEGRIQIPRGPRGQAWRSQEGWLVSLGSKDAAIPAQVELEGLGAGGLGAGSSSSGCRALVRGVRKCPLQKAVLHLVNKAAAGSSLLFPDATS